MADSSDLPKKKGAWRILKYVLPLFFLLTGFFGVQIWMVLDEREREKPEAIVTGEMKAPAIKADVAKIAESQGQVPGEKPVILAKAPAGSEQAVTSEIPQLVYYRLQTGSFKDKQGAEKLRKKLQEMGYGSLVINDGGQFAVITMAFFSREQAETLQEHLETKGIKGYPEKVTVPADMILLKGDSGRLQGFMDGSLPEIPEMLRETCDFYYIYESQGMDPASHDAMVLKQITRLSDMKTVIENMQVAPEDQELQRQFGEYLSGFIQYLEKAKKISKLDRKALWPGLLDRIEAYAGLGVLAE